MPMYTKNQALVFLLDDTGNITGNNSVTYGLTNVPGVDLVSTPPSDGLALKWDAIANSWKMGALTSAVLTDYAYQSDVTRSITELVGVASETVDTLGEVSHLFAEDTISLADIIDKYENDISLSFTGNGVKTEFDIEHTAGRISVQIDGVELIYNITDYSDTTGLNNIASPDYDFESVDSGSLTVNAKGAATAIKFLTAPILNSNIEVRKY